MEIRNSRKEARNGGDVIGEGLAPFPAS